MWNRLVTRILKFFSKKYVTMEEAMLTIKTDLNVRKTYAKPPKTETKSQVKQEALVPVGKMQVDTVAKLHNIIGKEQ